ncbi:hypothetical protein PAXY110619_17335 [Paenibacillus xylanexedens]
MTKQKKPVSNEFPLSLQVHILQFVILNLSIRMQRRGYSASLYRRSSSVKSEMSTSEPASSSSRPNPA